MIYEFYWSWYEDYSPNLFEHDELRTQKQWEEDCKRAMRETFDFYIDKVTKEKSWAGINDWVEVACDKLVEYGYRKCEKIKFGFFGGFIVRDDEIEEDCNHLKYFSEQCKRMSDWNKEFEEQRDMEMGIEKEV